MDIQVLQLKKSYFLNDSEIPVLRGINFSLNKGDFASLTGASGVGKSTLLHILGTLDTPTFGDVILDGAPIFTRSAKEIADFRNFHIGFVFQFHHLLPEFSALENTLLPLLIRRVNRRDAVISATSMLDLVGLSHRLHHKPGELSGGEQQRVALARALVGKPKLLLADEPTGNLDEKTGEGIFDILRQVNREEKVTVLVVTHNRNLAQQARLQLMLDHTGIRALIT